MMLEEALRYAAIGLPVLPLQPHGKIAINEHGSRGATTDEEQIRRWWTQWPQANIGIATGGRLVVIDEDNDEDRGKFGSEEVRSWEKKNGELPDTVTALTGGGGRHRYYITDGPEYRNAQSLLPAVDVRGDGGYVVAPPSVHENGHTYEWEEAPWDLDFYHIRPGDPVDRFLKSRRKKDKDQKQERPQEAIRSGTRTSSLVSLLGTLRDLGVSSEAIEEAVRAENAAKCDPPLTDEELEREVLPALSRDWIPTRSYTDAEYVVRPLPDPVVLSSVYQNPPALAPVLIDGVLRRGHKMLISGPSKAGKSFALMELAISIAEGGEWLGSICRPGNVLYMNMEIDDPSCFARFLKIYQEKKIPEPHPERITVWGLRGFALPLQKLASHIIEAAQGYAAIIIDPLYKVMAGADENSNGEVAQIISHFDRIADATGAAVIYAHHFAKGTAGDRDAIDRASGAGTFARDPDAILTMTQLNTDDTEDRTAWRLEYILREFPQHKPVSMWWDYPLHRVDPALDENTIRTSATNAAKRKEEADTNRRAEANARVYTAAMAALNKTKTGRFTLNQWREEYTGPDMADQTASRHLREAGFTILERPFGSPAQWGRE